MSHDTFTSASRAAGEKAKTTVTCTGYRALGGARAAARFVLPNGLHLILAHDDRAPIFSYQTWFKVGSKHEDPNRTGLAHLFEHLMFKGTRKYPTGTFDREMELRGSQTNAATWVDWTYYTQALAARGDNLATVIDFESDRMTGLVLDQDSFVSELEVVKNERRMSVEDSVVGTLGEELLGLAYATHPYRWPTIGSMAHLEASTLVDLEHFYRANYAPNNATVVLVGDIEPESALTMLAAAYAPLQAQRVLQPLRPPEPRQTAPRLSTIERPVMAPQLMVGFHAPPQQSGDFAALELLAEVLAAGETARLYERLVIELQLATEVSASVSPFSEPGLCEFYVAARPDVLPEKILQVLQTELDGTCAAVSPSEINKARNSLELGLVDSLRDVEGCAEALGHDQTNYGELGRAFSMTDTYGRVTEAQMRAVASDVFRITNRSTVVAVPPSAKRTS